MDIFYPFAWMADKFSHDILGLSRSSYLGEALSFFILDAFKIGLLLLLINLIMAMTRYYFPLEKARDILSRPRWRFVNYLLAAALGAITPFCSCSSIPLFVGFVGAGIPLGITFTFLLSSPLVNEASLYMFPAMFGWQTTIIYNLAGITIAIIAGFLLERMKMEKYLNREVLAVGSPIPAKTGEQRSSFRKILLPYFWKEGLTITRRLFPYVLIGVALGALIHGFVPVGFAENILSGNWWSVPAAVLLGAPLYANSVGVIPIMQALVGKGVPLGTALAFMTAITALSVPEALILKKVMKWRLLLTFFGLTIIGIILIGYLFNALL